jgi:hypothetical protein
MPPTGGSGYSMQPKVPFLDEQACYFLFFDDMREAGVTYLFYLAE